jgi:uncharacterized protein YbjT (DUF2867 family)
MYLVAGATGNVGSEVVAQLLADGEPVRVFTRDAAKVAHWGNRIEVATGDFRQADSFARAAAGAEALFVMTSGGDPAAFGRLIEAAKGAGAGRVVFLSSLLASEPEFLVGKMHREMEEAITRAGLAGTFVRPGAFMSNCLRWADSIRKDGVVYNPLGDGKAAPIAPEDIAAVAVKALIAKPQLPEQILEVTGGELLTVREQIDILARALGKPIRSVDIPVEAAVQELIRLGTPPHIAQGVGKSFENIRQGRGATVRNTVEAVLGRKPTTFESWVKKHIARFT